ncbi:hypothetical protein C0Q70_09735 [Pomacea canaliculata]|uniref:Uncharacterized protein n=1 Tax=Pomacea canaliculata TaxID=400727 RepID=A0A2T7PAM9_POMCA|nr:hypothetical protein C0Q70_09735 [Pomacea canaliculata]
MFVCVCARLGKGYGVRFDISSVGHNLLTHKSSGWVAWAMCRADGCQANGLEACDVPRRESQLRPRRVKPASMAFIGCDGEVYRMHKAQLEGDIELFSRRQHGKDEKERKKCLRRGVLGVGGTLVEKCIGDGLALISNQGNERCGCIACSTPVTIRAAPELSSSSLAMTSRFSTNRNRC